MASANTAALEEIVSLFRFDNASDYFERVWANNDWSLLWKPDEFVFEFGLTPMAHPAAFVPVIILYIGFAFFLQAVMKNREKLKLTAAVVVHNYILCFWSLAMFLGVVYEWWALLQNHYKDTPLRQVFICEPKAILTTPGSGSRMAYFIYIYFLSKFYEMIDTFILALKKRPLTFLQMYHHSIIVPLTFSWIAGHWSLAWYGVAANTLVHVFMYHYFALAALGKAPWWKALMTSGQLLQFSSVFVLIFVFVHDAYTGLSFNGQWPFLQAESELCNGDRRTVVFSQIINITFLYLFGNLFVNSYMVKKDTKKPGTAKSPAAKKKD